MASSWILTRTTKHRERRYRVEYRLGGRGTPTKYGGSFKTKREADERRRWIDGELAARRVPDLRSLAVATKAPTLEQAAQRWFESRVGTKIAFNSFISPDIYVINVDGSGLTRLTDDPANEARPDWSPDGRKIAFNSNRDAAPGNPADIYVMNADGSGEPVRLTAAPGADIGPDWSPNGQRITFESNRDGDREIYVMNADGTDQVQLTSNDVIDAFPSWSPDGREIVFHRQLYQFPPPLDPPNGSELFAVQADGSGERQLTFHARDSFSAFASWAPGHASESEAR